MLHCLALQPAIRYQQYLEVYYDSLLHCLHHGKGEMIHQPVSLVGTQAAHLMTGECPATATQSLLTAKASMATAWPLYSTVATTGKSGMLSGLVSVPAAPLLAAVL